MTLTGLIRKNVFRLIGSVVLLGASVTPGVASATSQPRDCDTNSIMYCGAYTKTEWVNKVENGDSIHPGSNLQDIYFDQGRGITLAEFEADYTIPATVYGHNANGYVAGDVVVNQAVVVNGHTIFDAGDVVGTSADSIGRTQNSSSWPSGSVWMRPVSSSFVADSITGWVDMQGGVMHWFILNSCGNAGIAVPVHRPIPSPSPSPTPKPSPKPSPSPSPTPSPVEKFECVDLKVTQADKDDKPNNYTFTIVPYVKNVTITGYIFTLSDSKNAVDTTSASISRDVTGSLTVQGQVKTNEGTTPLGECSATVNVTPSPTPTPTPTSTPTPTPTPQVLSTSTMPQTGAESMLGGAAGVSGLVMAGRTYLRSRKSVLSALRRKTPLQ